MDLKTPAIIETTGPEFCQRLRYWKRHELKIHDDVLLAKIEDPLCIPLISDNSAQDYFSLMEMLLDHPYADELCVRSQDRWIKEYTRRMNKVKLDFMARTAANNPSHINYFEIKFKKREIADSVEGTIPADRPVIEFVEYKSGDQRSIVGYQIIMPVEYEELFTVVRTSPLENFALIHGIWMPST